MNFSSIKCRQNNFTFYQTVIPSKTLLTATYIARRSDDKSKGFQRFLNEKRAKQIAEYLDEGNGSIPAPIIVSAQESADLKINNDVISMSMNENSLLVLDGQHRLYGYDMSDKDYDVPVVVYHGLSLPEEVALFIDINTNQKGVSSALLLDIKNLANRETPIEEKQRQLFTKLNKNSSVAGKLAPSRSMSGKISRKTFNDATKDLLENGPFKDKNVDIIYKGVFNFLEAAEIVLTQSKEENAKLNKTVMFKSLFRLFNEVINRSLNEFGDLKTDSLINTLEPIAIIDFDSFSGSNNTTIAELTNRMRSEITKTRTIKENMF